MSIDKCRRFFRICLFQLQKGAPVGLKSKKCWEKFQHLCLNFLLIVDNIFSYLSWEIAYEPFVFSLEAWKREALSLSAFSLNLLLTTNPIRSFCNMEFNSLFTRVTSSQSLFLSAILRYDSKKFFLSFLLNLLWVENVIQKSLILGLARESHHSAISK